MNPELFAPQSCKFLVEPKCIDVHMFAFWEGLAPTSKTNLCRCFPPCDNIIALTPVRFCYLGFSTIENHFYSCSSVFLPIFSGPFIFFFQSARSLMEVAGQ